MTKRETSTPADSQEETALPTDNKEETVPADSQEDQDGEETTFEKYLRGVKVIYYSERARKVLEEWGSEIFEVLKELAGSL